MLIGLCGPKGVGKNFIAGMMKAACPDIELVSFADPLKRITANLLGLTLDQVEIAKNLPDRIWGGGPTVRQFLQRLGVSGRTHLSNDIWIRAAGFGEGASKSGNIVVTDVRFPNEAQAIRSRGGLIVEVCRSGFGYSGEHPSEVRLPDELIDTAIENHESDGGIDAYHPETRADIYRVMMHALMRERSERG